MIHQFGDMFKETLGKKENLIVTTNSFVTKAGKLVMGRGAAKALVSYIPEIAMIFGRKTPHLQGYWLKNSRYVYGNITKIWAFQVKNHFRTPADLSLIKSSTAMLIREAGRHPDDEYHMNYPGIGNGQLRVKQVEPVVEALPENVYLWRFRK